MTRGGWGGKKTKPGRFDDLGGGEGLQFPAYVMTLQGARVPLVDGGVVANNPTACALAEGVKINAKLPRPKAVDLKNFIVASLGAGQSSRSISVSQAREWGAVEWAIPIIDVLFDGAGDATNYIVKQLVPEGRYFRLQAPLTDAFDDMDDATKTNVNALERIVRTCINNQDGGRKLDDLADLIRQESAAPV